MKKSHRRALTATAAIAAVITLAGPVGHALAAPAQAPAAGNFYLPPSPLPAGDNGDLIRSEPMRLLAGSPLAALIPAATSTRIMYRSTDTHGAPIAVTGTVLTPKAPWPGPGSRPLVSYAVGTHGAADSCAPSRLLANGIERDGTGTPMFEGQIIDMVTLLKRGIAVVITDYQGLGTPGGHTYLQPLPQARAVLDAARAAIRLGVVVPDTRVGIWGYSQGGGAAAAAAEQSHDYAGELNLVGTVAGAPTADPAATLRMGGDRKMLSGLQGVFVNGLIAGYPRLAPRILGLFNPAGIDYLHRTAQMCGFGAVRTEMFQDTSKYTRSGARLVDALESDPEIHAVLDSMIMGGTPPAKPVLIMQNINDDTVPAAATATMVAKWRAGGADVTEADINTPPLLPQLGAIGHTVGMMRYSIAENWLSDRFSQR